MLVSDFYAVVQDKYQWALGKDSLPATVFTSLLLSALDLSQHGRLAYRELL